MKALVDSINLCGNYHFAYFDAHALYFKSDILSEQADSAT